jgi:hypothetical protein
MIFFDTELESGSAAPVRTNITDPDLATGLNLDLFLPSYNKDGFYYIFIFTS